MRNFNRLNSGAMWLCIILTVVLGTLMIVNNSAQTATQTGNQNSNSAAKQTPTPKGKKTPPALKSQAPTPKLVLVQGTPASTPKDLAQQSPTPTPKPKVDQTPSPTPPSTPALKTSESSTNGTKDDDTSCGKCSSQTSTSQASTVIIRKKKDGSTRSNKPRVVKASQKADNGASNAQFLNPIAKVSSIKFGSNNIILNPGETKRVSYEIINSDYTVISLFENKSDVIEKVEIDGNDIVVKASSKSGTGRVAVYLKDQEDIQKSFSVTVNKPVVNDLNSDTETIDAVVGSEKIMIFTATTSNGTEVGTNLQAKIDNDKIGKISWTSATELTFTATGEGTGNIKVFSPSNPSQNVEIPIDVTKKAIKEVTVEKSSVDLKLGAADGKDATAEIGIAAVFNDGSYGEITFENSNPQIAATGIENGKLKIAANAAGTTIITVKSKDNPTLSKTITVNVTKVKIIKDENGNDKEVKVSTDEDNDGSATNNTGVVWYNPFSWTLTNWVLFFAFIVIVGGIVYGFARWNRRP